MFLVGIPTNLHLPLLLGRGHPQVMIPCLVDVASLFGNVFRSIDVILGDGSHDHADCVTQTKKAELIEILAKPKSYHEIT